MSDNNSYKGGNRAGGADDDYLDLLSSVDSDDSIDIFSDSSKKTSTSSYRDVYSHSSDDVYIKDAGSDNKKAAPENDDYLVELDSVFSDSGKRSYEDTYSYSSKQPKRIDYEERYTEPPQNTRPATAKPAPPPVKKQPQKKVDEDEISDFDARHGRNGAKKKKKQPVWLVVVAVILAIIIALGVFVTSSIGSVVNKFAKAEKIEHIEDASSLVSESYVRNILLVGLDNEQGGSSRSDSIMIASVNKKSGKIIVTSILRDTHLYIPGHQESKINAAYAYGGANLLIQTIEGSFGIKIDDYAVVNFDMFTELVNGLGGVDVEVTEAEANYLNDEFDYKSSTPPDHFDSGEKIHLNGYQALWYSRIRKLDSDFKRTERQRKVITSIVNKVKTKINPAGVFELIKTAKNVAPYIETTLSTTDFTNLILALSSCLVKSGMSVDKLLVSQQLPFEDTWYYDSAWDGSIIAIDLEENKKMLYSSIYESSSKTDTEESTKETTE